MKAFLTDVQKLGDRVRQEIRKGPATETEVSRSIVILNQALALNMVCVLRHMRHFVTADRFDARVLAQEFLEHTVRESENSDLIVTRIRELGGEPEYERHSAAKRGQLECSTSSEFEDIIRADLATEQSAIAAYAEMIAWLADVDPISSELLQQILSLEEEHAEVMLNFVTVVIT
ncbi:MAG TPA: ferritin-like domain-containing protein [Acidimicrobiales bacterium]|nr:ferritin-like domain-containing protein [Acidimicrobiales bacterium]